MTTISTDIWSFNRSVSHRLTAWAGACIVGGILAMRADKGFRRAFGTQCIAWGAIDAALALGGQLAAEKKQGAATQAVEAAQAQQLRRLLRLNAGLDVLYIAGGAALYRSARNRSAHDRTRQGHGAAIIVQGAFLFVFDLVHALRVPQIEKP